MQVKGTELNEWMNEKMKQRVWCCKREETERNSRFSEENLLPTRAGVPSFLRDELPRSLKWKLQSFPHFRIDTVRVFTKPAFWKGSQVAASVHHLDTKLPVVKLTFVGLRGFFPPSSWVHWVTAEPGFIASSLTLVWVYISAPLLTSISSLPPHSGSNLLC